jgi:endogenous inhibitor of DNA gyrase (YacG/DUF329 family)
VIQSDLINDWYIGMAQKDLELHPDLTGLHDLPLENDARDQNCYHTEFMEELSNMLSDSSYGLSPLREEEMDLDKITVTTQTPDSLNPEQSRKCSICSQPCVGYKGMRQHIAKAHSSISKTVGCPTCGKRFKHKNAVKFHTRQVHDKSTRVNCPVCHKEIYNKYMLKKHLKNNHYTPSN